MNKAHFINTLAISLLALGTAVWSFFGLQTADLTDEIGWQMDDGLSFGTELNVDSPATFMLNGRDSLSLEAGTTATLNWDEQNKHLTVELKGGAVLFATLADDFSVSVLTGFARIDSQNSVAYVSLDSNSQIASVFALNHASLLSLVLDGTDLNSLSIPNQYKVTVPASKVSSTLSKLRLAKLSKEFPVFAIVDSDLTDELNSLSANALNAYSNSTSAFFDHVATNSDFGPAVSGFGSKIHLLAKSFRSALTFSKNAEEDFVDSQTDDALIFAMTNLLYGDKTVGETWLNEWLNSDHSREDLRSLYSELSSVLPGDDLYPVKKAIWGLIYSSNDSLDKMQLLRYRFSEVESLLLKADFVDALTAYKDYQNEFETALNTGVFDDIAWLAPINREYMLLELMLRSNSVFYSTESVKLLKDLEDKIFVLAGSGTDLNEERQAFVQSKLRFLENLFTFVMDKKVSIEEATNLSKELIFEADAYMAKIPSSVAVKEYFESKLLDYTLSVEFMNSPEFYTYDSFADGLNAYKIKKNDIDELNAYLQSIRSGESLEADLSLEEATKQAKDDLYANGIQYSDLVSLNDASYRLFTVEGARASGYAFSAKYDRETQILYDVVVGETRFSSGLSLKDASTVIEQTMGSLTDSGEDIGTSDQSNVTDASDSLSSKEKVALELIKNHFEEASINVDGFTFNIVDLDENTFTFKGTLTEESLPVSGTYNTGTGLATEIIWELSGAPNSLADTDLANLEANLLLAYQTASSK